MESTLAWIFAFLVASVAVTFVVLFQKRAEERFRLLAADRSRILERERELASRYNALERAHEVALAERAAIELDRERLFAEVDHRHRRIADALTRLAASVDERETEIDKFAAAGARRVLAFFPDIVDPAHRALGASLGALLSVHAYVQLAVQKKAQKIEEVLGNDEAEVEVNTVRPAPDSGRRWMQLLGEQDPEDDDAQTADSTPTPVR